MFKTYAVKLDTAEVAEAGNKAEIHTVVVAEKRPSERALLVAKLRRKYVGDMCLWRFIMQTGLLCLSTEDGIFVCQRKKQAKSKPATAILASVCSDNQSRDAVYMQDLVLASSDCPDVFVCVLMHTPMYCEIEGWLTSGDFRDGVKYPNGIRLVPKDKLKPLSDLISHLKAIQPWEASSKQNAAPKPKPKTVEPEPESDGCSDGPDGPEQEMIDPADVPFAM
jgi:hypothetical protein